MNPKLKKKIMQTIRNAKRRGLFLRVLAKRSASPESHKRAMNIINSIRL